MEESSIIFDLFGVITKEPYFATEVVFPLIKDKIDYNLFKKRYILLCVGLISYAEFWQNIGDGKEIKDIEQKILAKTLPNEDIVSLIHQLRPSRRLSIASEVPAVWARMLLTKLDIQDCFDDQFYSSDLQATKPFKAFYDKVFTSRPPRVIYVDDALENIIAAKNYDAEVVWYGGSNTTRPDLPIASTASELEKFL